MPTTPAFETGYAKLNESQKRAVDAVEGPVMVIAGPGTGKTHILTLRIANILAKTDAQADSILALTFTDSAARTIKSRLGSLIGEEAARKVGTYTFHSFAGEVIRTNPESFAAIADSRLMGEVEQVLLWREVLESRPITHLATAKAPFHYLDDLKALEEQLTRECISLDEYRRWIEAEADHIRADESLQYVRGANKGELNGKGREKLGRLDKAFEAIELIGAYRDLKEARKVYGYTDVLRFATDALKTDDALRATLQERYQYILADEHQDANALQHALLDALAFDDHPNLFIVGDEKQAIFGFQGADATHFRAFMEHYPRTQVISLTDNYRSYQDILDLSHTLLKDLPSQSGGHVELMAARGAGGSIGLLAAPDALAERDQIATLVEKAIAEGIPPHEIAVITLKNRTADAFALHLRARGISTLRAGDIDFSGRPRVRALLSLMRAVANPLSAAALREALLAPWWQAPLGERLRLLRQTRDRELSAELLERFPDIANVIATLQEQSREMPPVSLFSRLLIDSGARAHLLSTDDSLAEDVPLVRQLMLYLEELALRSPNATFAELMEIFEKAQEHDIGTVKTTLTQREGYVTVITAHKAKGMEFSRVFVAALSAREWEGRGRSALIPSPFSAAREKEEVVRLFYVALTRAKDQLVLSYPAHSAEGKEEAPMSLLPTGLIQIDVPHDPLPQLHVVHAKGELVRELTGHYLSHEGLSPSAYNDYLKSPATFFARYVLKLREPQNRAMVGGTAVHAAIAAYLKHDSLEEDERLVRAKNELRTACLGSLLPRGDSFDALMRHAENSFESYVAHATPRTVLAIEESFAAQHGGASLTGRVDAIFAGAQGECIVDFKTTGTIDAKKKAEYARQLAFYDYLLSQNGRTANEALIIQIEEDGVTELPLPLSSEVREEFIRTLDAVLEELTAGTWRSGEPSEYDSLLALL